MCGAVACTDPFSGCRVPITERVEFKAHSALSRGGGAYVASRYPPSLDPAQGIAHRGRRMITGRSHREGRLCGWPRSRWQR
jgi:hypothetical protein